MKRIVTSLFGWLAFCTLLSPAHAQLPKADGYRGIWYQNQPSGDEYAYKYSGGFATYPHQHVPVAIHAPAANKTFFVYGGTIDNLAEKRELLHMVSYYDHATGQVPRPTILLNKHTNDAHDNPTLLIDKEGYLWIFSNAHGTSRPAFIHRSKRPYDVDDFELVSETNFSYSQPWYLPEHGFVFLHTRYLSGRHLFCMTSRDGRTWSEPQPYTHIERGQYQVSWPYGNRLGTVFDFHPKPIGLNARTNLYYLQTPDGGRTWQTAAGKTVTTPLDTAANPALVHDYQSEGLLVYIKDLQYDAQGRPVILYLTSRDYRAGPVSGPRPWYTAHWQGDTWRIRPITTSDHNYDCGPLYIEQDQWRLIAPTDAAAQPWNTGGEVVLWTSRDEGATWKKERRVTDGSTRDHTFVRRPLGEHDDFYAIWADGLSREPSDSALFFTNRACDTVWKLPMQMTGEFARPEPLGLSTAHGKRAK